MTAWLKEVCTLFVLGFTNDGKVYEYIKSIYSHGMTNVRYIHNKLAYNYRMTNVQAAFLYDQLNDLDHILTLKQKLFKNYDKFLEKALKDVYLAKMEEAKLRKKVEELEADQSHAEPEEWEGRKIVC